MTFEELQKIVYDAGIVGAGGAGFPTHRKFSDKVKQIIVNAAECEPLMMVDHHILEHHLQALVDTLNVLIDTMVQMRQLSVLRVRICTFWIQKLLHHLRVQR